MKPKIDDQLFLDLVLALGYLKQNPDAVLKINRKGKNCYKFSACYDYAIEAFYGELMVNKDIISFIGQNVAELAEAFKESLDDYINFTTP